jgi:hypothetical protein
MLLLKWKYGQIRFLIRSIRNGSISPEEFKSKFEKLQWEIAQLESMKEDVNNG